MMIQDQWIRRSILAGLVCAACCYCRVCVAAQVPESNPAPPHAIFLTPIAVADAPQDPRVTPVTNPGNGVEGKVQAKDAGKLPDFTAPPGSALVPTDEQLINLPSALQLAEAQNPSIGLSRQAIQDALAQQLQARSMMLPSVHAGANYHSHQGVYQASQGTMREVDVSSLYLGNGAYALSATTAMIPGIQLYGHVGDGIYEPLAAQQLVTSRNFQAQATSNQVLLEVTDRFLDLVRAEAEMQSLRRTEQDMDEAVKITRAFAKAQQGREADAMRVQTAALLLHSQLLSAEEKLLKAAAELTRVLSLDPVIRLRTTSHSDGLLELQDARQDLPDLLRVAYANRPELAALSAEIARKQIQVRQERMRPFLPTISLGFSAGRFGGGVDPTLGNFNNRTDVDLIAFWTLQNMGAGNRALQKERLSEQEQAMLERERIANKIGREVASARALVLSRQESLDIARSRVFIAERAFREDLNRIKSNIGLPIELLNTLDRLASARVGVLRVIQEYNFAQMQLFVALGQTPLAAPIQSPKQN